MGGTPLRAPVPERLRFRLLVGLLTLTTACSFPQTPSGSLRQADGDEPIIWENCADRRTTGFAVSPGREFWRRVFVRRKPGIPIESTIYVDNRMLPEADRSVVANGTAAKSSLFLERTGAHLWGMVEMLELRAMQSAHRRRHQEAGALMGQVLEIAVKHPTFLEERVRRGLEQLKRAG